MNATELRTKARERLAEIASERKALDAEERELRVMLGEPAPTITITSPFVIQYPERETVQPMVRPMPYDVRPIVPFDPPGLPPPPYAHPMDVTCEDEAHALADLIITSRTTGCAVILPTIPCRIGAEHSTPDEGIVYGAAS